MDKHLQIILSLSILLPIIVLLIRWKRVTVRFLPLSIILLIGLTTELSQIFLIKQNGAPFNNVFILIEGIFLMWQFYVWRNVIITRDKLGLVISLLVVTWIIDMLIIGPITEFRPYYQSIYSFIIILFSISQINYLLINTKESILQNPIFITCTSFLLCYTYKILVETAYYFAISPEIKSQIFAIHSYNNFICNLLFFIAFLCIPKKQSFLKL